MKIDQLNYFLEVANQGHLGKAAKILNISPSAISHSIASLEEELGQELFFREHKRIFLSPQGKLLQKRVGEILGQIKQLKEEVSNENAPMSGHFRIAANSAFMDKYLIPAWSKLLKGNSALSGEIYSLRSTEVLERAANGEIDFGLCFSPEASSLVNMQVINRGNLIVAVGKNHPVLKHKGEERLRVLNSSFGIAPKAAKGIENCERHPVLKKIGLISNIQTVFETYAVGISLLKKSEGWALVPDFLMMENEGELIAVFPNQPPAPYTVTAVWPKERPLLKPLTTLLEYLN